MNFKKFSWISNLVLLLFLWILLVSLPWVLCWAHFFEDNPPPKKIKIDKFSSNPINWGIYKWRFFYQCFLHTPSNLSDFIECLILRFFVCLTKPLSQILFVWWNLKRKIEEKNNLKKNLFFSILFFFGFYKIFSFFFFLGGGGVTEMIFYIFKTHHAK